VNQNQNSVARTLGFLGVGHATYLFGAIVKMNSPIQRKRTANIRIMKLGMTAGWPMVSIEVVLDSSTVRTVGVDWVIFAVNPEVVSASP